MPKIALDLTWIKTKTKKTKKKNSI